MGVSSETEDVKMVMKASIASSFEEELLVRQRSKCFEGCLLLDDDILLPSYTSPATSRHAANTIEGKVGEPGHYCARSTTKGRSSARMCLTIVYCVDDAV